MNDLNLSSGRYRRSGTKRRRVRCPREFSSTEHISLEAVAAFVDGELTAVAAHRVRVHLVHCAECRREVHRQRNASEWLRGSNITEEVRAPQDLLTRLAGIAANPQKPGPDAEAIPTPAPQGLLDKVEMLLRAVKRTQQR
ncbi:anti-sigma factor family protein [Corynebacterium alimapuense]|uniref:Putative zinc-finger domain-containing protein n=1 Tax=Corynebacterium alimapuense TaxID=1576874 RepID=A0A3M8K5F1_9CORY|nr:anti-sigma factor [Corynebacterium alimapuense]RNE48457.1 hypothetical protein C5L39_08090 [Corynebacterium alimapuense]